MEFENDFVDEKPVAFEIDGRKFKLKPVTAGDENDWSNEYISLDEKGNKVTNIDKINECKMRNLVEVPYGKERINNQIGVDKEWKDLSQSEQWSFLRGLNRKLFNKIVLKIEEIDNPSTKEKKN